MIWIIVSSNWCITWNSQKDKLQREIDTLLIMMVKRPNGRYNPMNERFTNVYETDHDLIDEEGIENSSVASKVRTRNRSIQEKNVTTAIRQTLQDWQPMGTKVTIKRNKWKMKKKGERSTDIDWRLTPIKTIRTAQAAVPKYKPSVRRSK